MLSEMPIERGAKSDFHVRFEPMMGLSTKRTGLATLWLMVWASLASAEVIETTTSAIVNGSRAPRSVGLSPAEQLAIGWISNYMSPETTFCTGTLITSRIVITAKHCLRNRQANELTFGLGVEPENGPAMFEVSAIELHPEADAAMLFLAKDVMDTLVQIGRGMGLAETEVKPIPPNRHTLDDAEGEPLFGRMVEVAGYGETQNPEQTGRYFASVELTDITDEFIVVNGNGVAGLCFGDSGGPVLAINVRGKPVILGVEHGGGDSCRGTDYLARLDKIRDWVDAGIQRMWAENPVGGPCRDLGFKGRCVGDTAEWCDENFAIRRRDCGALNSACTFVDEETGYYCNSPRNCDIPNEFCESVLEGFIPPGPLSVSQVGGCSLHATSPSEWFPYCLTLLLLGLYRRARP